jgi:hypothetical protein
MPGARERQIDALEASGGGPTTADDKALDSA